MDMVSVDRLQRWYPETMASSITSACVWLSGVLWMIFWADGIRNIGKGKGERGTWAQCSFYPRIQLLVLLVMVKGDEAFGCWVVRNESSKLREVSQSPSRQYRSSSSSSGVCGLYLGGPSWWSVGKWRQSRMKHTYGCRWRRAQVCLKSMTQSRPIPISWRGGLLP